MTCAAYRLRPRITVDNNSKLRISLSKFKSESANPVSAATDSNLDLDVTLVADAILCSGMMRMQNRDQKCFRQKNLVSRAHRGSNTRPIDLQSIALPLSYTPSAAVTKLHTTKAIDTDIIPAFYVISCETKD